MKITINPVLDMETLHWVSNDGEYEYDGPVVSLRGEDRPDQAAAQQAAAAQQKQNAQLYSQQQQVQNLMLPQYMAMLKNPAAATAEGSEAASAFGSAQDALASRAAKTGNSAGVVEAQDKLAMDKAQTLSDITMKNRNEALTGLQSLYGTDTNLYAKALGIPVEYLNTAEKAGEPKGTQTWDVISSLLGAGGQVGAAALKCWVAAELYGGWFAPETVSVREWLDRTWYAKPFAALYGRVGKRWASLIARNRIARGLTKLLFDSFLRRARRKRIAQGPERPSKPPLLSFGIEG